MLDDAGVYPLEMAAKHVRAHVVVDEDGMDEQDEEPVGCEDAFDVAEQVLAVTGRSWTWRWYWRGVPGWKATDSAS